MELETALRVEQDRAADLIGKLTFYGNAYQKLQGKLTGKQACLFSVTLSTCCYVGGWLCVILQKLKVNGFLGFAGTASEKQIASLKATIQEQKEKYTALRNQSENAANEAQVVLAGAVYNELCVKRLLWGLLFSLCQRTKTVWQSSLARRADLCACVETAERTKTEELEGVIAEKELRTVDLSNKVTFYGQAYQKLQGKLSGMKPYARLPP